MKTHRQITAKHGTGKPKAGEATNRADSKGRRPNGKRRQSRNVKSTPEANEIEDITERKRTEEKLREMLEAIQLIAVLLDLEGRVTFCNGFLLQITGYGRDEVLGCDWFAQFVPEVRSDVKELFLQGLQRGEIAVHYENPIRTKSGEERFIRFSNTILRDAQGKAIGTTSLGEDITERKRADAERESLLNVLEASLNEIYIFAPDTLKFQYASTGAVRNLGYSREQLKTLTPLDLKPEFTEASFREMIGPLLRRETDEHIFQTVHRRADDSLYPVEVHLQLVESAGDPVFLAVILDITERKKAEEALSESERRFRNLADNSPDAIYTLDLVEHRLIFFNRDEFCGYSRQELMETSNSILAAVHPDEQGAVSKHWQALLRGDPAEVRVMEYRLRRKDGDWEWVQSRETILARDKNEQPTQLLVTLTLITERKRAEMERDRLFNFSIDLFCIAGFDGYFKQLNPAWEKTLGWTNTELMSKPYIEFVHPDDREATAHAIGTLINGRLVFAFDNRYLCKDGTYKWISWNSYPLGEEALIFAVARDITERKRVEEELIETNKLLNELIQRSPLAIVTIDPQGNVKVWNPSAEHLFGWLAEEVMDKPVPIIPDEEREQFSSLIFAELQGEVRSGLELRRRRKDGAFVDVSLWTAPLSSAKGRITGTIGMFVDSTEPKRAEDELRLSRKRLAELSRRLVETHEEEARAIGRELHDQIGQMLTALKLMLKIAPQLPPEQAQKRFAQAHELVDELLNRVSRLSLELRPPMLDDLGLIPALLWHVNRYQEQTNIAVDFKHSGAEGIRFENEIETTAYRIIQESLTNVARHAHATRARLEVRVLGERIEIQVEDNGAGFDLQAAFDKQRGLSGMRERVRLLGGSFQIESQPGKGAKKVIQLPLREKTT